MSQNQEIIEAKLCAYIDGELDPEGRSEIEKHLEANPQHRRLLESLRATRDLLKWLPREPAPPEVAETLNGQLERSVLLDYDGESLRPHIFPRLLATAAIIVLTAGLAAAVYFALPKSQRNAIAFHGDGTESGHAAAPAGEETPLASAGDARLSPAEAGRPERLAKGGESELGKVSAKSAPGSTEQMYKAGLQGTSDVEELDKLANEVAQNPRGIWNTASAAANTATEPAQVAGNAVVVLLRCNDRNVAERQLTGYFDTNRIQWKPAEPEAQVEQQRSPRFAYNQAAPAQSAPQIQQGKDGAEFQERKIGAERAAPAAPAEPSVDRERRSVASNLRAAATEPAATESESLAQAGGTQRQYAGRRAGLDNAANFRANSYFVARMSRRQKDELKTTMTRDGAQAAELSESPGAQIDNADEAQQNGLLRARGMASVAPQQPGSIGAAPMRRDQAQGRGDGGRELKQASTARGGEGPDTQPTAGPAAQQPQATGQTLEVPSHGVQSDRAASADADLRSSQKRNEPRPTATPSDLAREVAPATAPAEEPVNVVIVVQPADEAQDNAPATQPAASAPQTQPAPTQQPDSAK